MGQEFHGLYHAAREIFEEANAILGYDLAKLCFNGPADELSLTHNTQPALLTVSIAIWRVVQEEAGFEPAFMAGHSLGEYTALVASGALQFGDAVRLVHMRGRFMQEAVPRGAGSMAAIIGLDREQIEEICRLSSAEKEVAVPANINSPAQIVISGDREAVERASAIASERGALRVIKLPVSVPSHSPLMKIASERLAAELKGITLDQPTVPIVTNVEAKPTLSKDEIKKLLIRQLYSPVRWVESIRTMASNGATTFIEVGQGKVLSGLIKRIDKGLKTVTIEKPADIESLRTLA